MCGGVVATEPEAVPAAGKRALPPADAQDRIGDAKQARTEVADAAGQEEVDQICDDFIEFKKLINIELSQECLEKANEIFDLF